MSVNASTPWHKASFDRFLQDGLPALLAERLPLVGYQAEGTRGRALPQPAEEFSAIQLFKIQWDLLPFERIENRLLINTRKPPSNHGE